MIGSLAAVQSIVNMSARMATTLIDFREAVVAQLAELPKAQLSFERRGRSVELDDSDTSLRPEWVVARESSQQSEAMLKSPLIDDD